EGITAACVGHDPAQPDAAFVQGASDVEQEIGPGRNAGAVAVDIHLDPDLEGLAVLAAEARHGLRAGDVVGDQLQVAAFPPQCQCPGQLVRGYTHRVEDVVETGGE